MIKKTIYYFERGGPENTEQCIEIAKERIKDSNIKYIIVATTRGETGVEHEIREKS